MSTAVDRHQVRRQRQRAAYDRASIHRILDAGWIAHVGFSVRAQPFVIPMLYAREGDALLLHGSLGSRLMRTLGSGVEACVSVALVDGLVLARSHFNHSMNYRSVVAYGRATPIDVPEEKALGLARLVDSLIPGRAGESRPADAQELAATALLRFEIDDASAKVRSGPPSDTPADLGLPFWAGELPLHPRYAAARPAPDLAPGSPLPNSLRRLLAEAQAVPAA
jgi:nitroimidazol reductase NimA-like FMN-containing flavoprotein (pyridoxamine 5'-phosphate oxidase superfamily)